MWLSAAVTKSLVLVTKPLNSGTAEIAKAPIMYSPRVTGMVL